jgi:hypothetical protein
MSIQRYQENMFQNVSNNYMKIIPALAHRHTHSLEIANNLKNRPENSVLTQDSPHQIHHHLADPKSTITLNKIL